MRWRGRFHTGRGESAGLSLSPSTPLATANATENSTRNAAAATGAGAASWTTRETSSSTRVLSGTYPFPTSEASSARPVARFRSRGSDVDDEDNYEDDVSDENEEAGYDHVNSDRMEDSARPSARCRREAMYQRLSLNTALRGDNLLCAGACIDEERCRMQRDVQHSYQYAVALHDERHRCFVILLYAQAPSSIDAENQALVPRRVHLSPVRRTRIRVVKETAPTQSTPSFLRIPRHRGALHIITLNWPWRAATKLILVFPQITMCQTWERILKRVRSARSLGLRESGAPSREDSPSGARGHVEEEDASFDQGGDDSDTLNSAGARASLLGATGSVWTDSLSTEAETNQEMGQAVAARTMCQVLVLALVIVSDVRRRPRPEAVQTSWQALMHGGEQINAQSICMLGFICMTCLARFTSKPCLLILRGTWFLFGMMLASDACSNDLSRGDFLLASIKVSVLVAYALALFLRVSPWFLRTTGVSRLPLPWAVKLPLLVGLGLHVLCIFFRAISGSFTFFFPWRHWPWEDIVGLGFAFVGPDDGPGSILLPQATQGPRQRDERSDRARYVGANSLLQALVCERELTLPKAGVGIMAAHCLSQGMASGASIANVLFSSFVASFALLAVSIDLPALCSRGLTRDGKVLVSIYAMLSVWTMLGSTDDVNVWIRTHMSCVGFVARAVHAAQALHSFRVADRSSWGVVVYGACVFWLPLTQSGNLMRSSCRVINVILTESVWLALSVGGYLLGTLDTIPRQRSRLSQDLWEQLGPFQILSELGVPEVSGLAMLTGAFTMLWDTHAPTLLGNFTASVILWALIVSAHRRGPASLLARFISDMGPLFLYMMLYGTLCALVIVCLASTKSSIGFKFWPSLLFVQAAGLWLVQPIDRAAQQVRRERSLAPVETTHLSRVTTWWTALRHSWRDAVPSAPATSAHARATRLTGAQRQTGAPRFWQNSMWRARRLQRQTSSSKLQRKIVPNKEGDVGLADACTICLEDYRAGEEVAKTLCGHFFHADCIEAWTMNACPLCRQASFAQGEMHVVLAK